MTSADHDYEDPITLADRVEMLGHCLRQATYELNRIKALLEDRDKPR